MNRLYDLRKTLPKNIEDNKTYENVEFVVLNYGSSDGMDEWAKEHLANYIESGIVNYYSVLDEIEWYSASHSRNIAFKLAKGDIVNQVDADNFVNSGFAERVNELANVQLENALFCKSKKLNHGRIGMAKASFMALGGYDEELDGYGHEDPNLIRRATHLGFEIFWYGRKYCSRIKTPREDKVANMKDKDWKATEDRNKEITQRNLDAGKFHANVGRPWGKAKVIKNFEETLEI